MRVRCSPARTVRLRSGPWDGCAAHADGRGDWRGAAPVFIEPCQRAELAWRDPYLVARSDPAYIVFTSGSTGRPKGVVLPHRSLRAAGCSSAALVSRPPGISRSLRAPCGPGTDWPDGSSTVELTPDVINTRIPHVDRARKVADLLRWEVVAAAGAEKGGPGRTADAVHALLNTSRSVGDAIKGKSHESPRNSFRGFFFLNALNSWDVLERTSSPRP